MIKKFVLDLFFPKKCLGCNKGGTYICDNCLDKVDLIQSDKNQKLSNLDRLIWAVPYSNPLVKALIKNFKYHYVKELAKPLAQLLIKSLGTFNFELLTLNFVVIPVPLHKRKLRERGFNQAELLAKEVVEHFSLPLENNVLIRKKYTPQQARTRSPKIRQKALKNAFDINPEFAKKCVAEKKNLLKNKTIILVDDVATTGTTLSEAAKVLKQAGAKEIWGLVIAKG